MEEADPTRGQLTGTADTVVVWTDVIARDVALTDPVTDEDEAGDLGRVSPSTPRNTALSARVERVYENIYEVPLDICRRL